MSVILSLAWELNGDNFSDEEQASKRLARCDDYD